jgi:hypothetical protein
MLLYKSTVTGSEMLQREMRTEAHSLGLSLSQHGFRVTKLDPDSKLDRVGGGTMLDPTEFSDERAVFAKLGLTYVLLHAPTLCSHALVLLAIVTTWRTNAALRIFSLFRQLSEQHIQLHMHSNIVASIFCCWRAASSHTARSVATGVRPPHTTRRYSFAHVCNFLCFVLLLLHQVP